MSAVVVHRRIGEQPRVDADLPGEREADDDARDGRAWSRSTQLDASEALAPRAPTARRAAMLITIMPPIEPTPKTAT